MTGSAVPETDRPYLTGIAYRMLGSVSDAEDAVQDAFARWLREDRTNIENPRAWMIKVVTRICLDQLKSARRSREEYVGIWLPEPIGDAPFSEPDRVELVQSLSIAFLHLMEELTPTQRAAFLLHDVFGYSFADVSDIIERSESSCRQLASRARTLLLAAQEANTDLFRASSRADVDVMVEAFFEASEQGDVGHLEALLAEDVRLYSDGGGRAPSALNVIYGSDHVCRFLAGVQNKQPEGAKAITGTVNGLPGIVGYVEDELYFALSVEINDGRISKIFIIRNPDKLRHIG